jgi:DNA (cytosine-5)-methyltransferase 1
MNGLDLFSGIGGLTLALQEWVSPIAYCEIDPYCQGVLASRMSERKLPIAPIWDDVRTLSASILSEQIDIVYGGFPCQDISVAGRGKGLEGERSSLFFEIMRLVRECKPTFIFLENVPAIRTRGLDAVLKEITDAGYDCRWSDLSAREIGANHNRKRWWLLGYSKHNGSYGLAKSRSAEKAVRNDKKRQNQTSKFKGASASGVLAREYSENRSWYEIEPCVGRVANGICLEMDRIKSLGNAVVPAQAREAFKVLMGIE